MELRPQQYNRSEKETYIPVSKVLYIYLEDQKNRAHSVTLFRKKVRAAPHRSVGRICSIRGHTGRITCYIIAKSG